MTATQLTQHIEPARSDNPHGNAAETVGAVLVYGLATKPSPLRAVNSDESPPADLTIIASRRSSTEIECRSVTVTIPAGSDATHLVSDTHSLTATTDQIDWSVRIDTSLHTVTFDAPADHPTVVDKYKGVTLTLSGLRPNAQVGTADLTVELSWRPDGEEEWTSDTTVLPISKFPPGFELSELNATPLLISRGGSTTLSWHSTGGTLELHYGNLAIDVTGRSSFVVHGVERDTAFRLLGRSNSPSGELNVTRQVLVRVDLPDVEANTLTALRGISVDIIEPHPGRPRPEFRKPLHHVPGLRLYEFDDEGKGVSGERATPVRDVTGRPTAVEFRDELHCVHPVGDEQPDRWVAYDAKRWHTPGDFPGRGSATSAPSLAVLDGTMHALYEKDGGIHLASTDDGRHWRAEVRIEYTKGTGLGRLTAVDGLLYSTAGNETSIWVSRHSPDGTTAAVEHTIGVAAGYATLVGHAGQLHCFVNDVVGRLTVHTRTGGTWSGPRELGYSRWPSSAASLGAALYLLTYTRDGAPHLHTFDGEKLSDPTPLSMRPAVGQGCLTVLAGRLIALHR